MSSERHKRLAYKILRIGLCICLLSFSAQHIYKYISVEEVEATSSVMRGVYVLIFDAVLPGILGLLTLLLLIETHYYRTLEKIGYLFFILLLDIRPGLEYSDRLIMLLCVFFLILYYEYHSRKKSHRNMAREASVVAQHPPIGRGEPVPQESSHVSEPAKGAKDEKETGKKNE